MLEINSVFGTFTEAAVGQSAACSDRKNHGQRTRKPFCLMALINLDASLRVNMRVKISQLQKELGITTIYVTHDQAEAMTLADRIVVLNNGKIIQIGSPRDLYNTPQHIFVAGFIGNPRMNLLDYVK